jgi:hypothetical protein
MPIQLFLYYGKPASRAIGCNGRLCIPSLFAFSPSCASFRSAWQAISHWLIADKYHAHWIPFGQPAFSPAAIASRQYTFCKTICFFLQEKANTAASLLQNSQKKQPPMPNNHLNQLVFGLSNFDSLLHHNVCAEQGIMPLSSAEVHHVGIFGVPFAAKVGGCSKHLVAGDWP